MAEFMSPTFLIILAGFMLIVLELFIGVSTGFDFLVLGVVFIISGLLGMILHSLVLSVGCVAFLSFLYVVFGRRFIKSKLSVATTKTNVDSILHEEGVVIKEIKPNHPGQIKVEGEVWRAQSKRLCGVGEKVMIQSVSGITLQVQ